MILDENALASSVLLGAVNVKKEGSPIFPWWKQFVQGGKE
jgi:hypothetical protein